MARWLRRLAARFDPRARDPEMDDEIALHIELHATTLEQQGLSRADALRQARIDFGGIQRYREEARETHPLRGALTTVGFGVLIGGPLAVAAGQVLSSLLYGVAASDVTMILVATLGLAATGIIASALPAWRASKVDPAISLRAG